MIPEAILRKIGHMFAILYTRMTPCRDRHLGGLGSPEVKIHMQSDHIAGQALAAISSMDICFQLLASLLPFFARHYSIFVPFWGPFQLNLGLDCLKELRRCLFQQGYSFSKIWYRGIADYSHVIWESQVSHTFHIFHMNI